MAILLTTRRCPTKIGAVPLTASTRMVAPARPNRFLLLLSLLTVLGLLAFPVEYRAGAAAAHPHAGLQVWWEHARAVPHDHSHAPAGADAAVRLDPLLDPGREPATLARSALGLVAPSPSDLPGVGELSPSVGSLAALVVALSVRWPTTRPPRRAPVWPVPLAWAALPSIPETPPPRAVALGRALPA